MNTRARIVWVGVLCLAASSGCDDNQYASNTAMSEADTSGEPDLSNDAPSIEDTTPNLPTPLSPEACVVTIESDNGAPWDCGVEVTSNVGCDDLARCLCRYHLSEHDHDGIMSVEMCVASITPLRGAPTLSDICAHAGSPVTSSIEETISGLRNTVVYGEVLMEDETITTSGACELIGASSLWAEPPDVGLTITEPGQLLPDVGPDMWDWDAFELQNEPLLTMAHTETFDSRWMRLTLNEDGAIALDTIAGDNNAGLFGRSFLVHGQQRALFSGRFASFTMSATVEQPTVLIEDLAESDFSLMTFANGYPSSAPAQIDSNALAQLRARFASQRKLIDNTCWSTCGCLLDQICQEGVCQETSCTQDADCCQGVCQEGMCTQDARR